MSICVELVVPPDKSISHRAVIFSSLAIGDTIIKNFLFGQDCLSTASVMQNLGVSLDLDEDSKKVFVRGVGKFGLSKPSCILDAGNSGTTIRIVSGILAAQNFDSIITGDDSLKKRPMKRVVDPLSKMGANIRGSVIEGKDEIYPPLFITGSPLSGTRLSSNIASAQVKSAVLLAGIYAKGSTSYKEPILSRDHTERMFSLFGAELGHRDGWILVNDSVEFKSPGEIYIPGDISSAAFLIALGILLPNCEICIKKVGINPTRAGILEVLKEMGANILLKDVVKTPEPYADIVVKSSSLHGIKINYDCVPKLIDEIPILAVVASFAKGKTYIEGVDELRVKECDRLEAIRFNLEQIGCEVNVITNYGRSDLEIIPPRRYKFFDQIKTWSDHRMVMSLTVAALKLGQNLDCIKEKDAVDISYPDFWDTLKLITKGA